MPRIDETRPFIPVRIAILTMSDTRSLEEDKSGSLLADLLTTAGHELADRAICTDDVGKIQATVQGWLDDAAIDVVVTTGGTGFTGRDVTPEALQPLFEKHIDGFSAIFHKLSYDKIETSTIQSRACAGVAKGTYVFCLPGSPGACRDAWDGILKWQLDNRHRPCNFVEIMPRLEEHRRVAS
ncbi:MAG: molybdenum cofactor biosynthesis protein B [Pseudomonadota bacterium]